MQIVFWVSLGMLFYLYVGYWGLLWLLPRRRATAGNGALRAPTVSLIIPAHNEERVLRQKLENALDTVQFPRERYEIIVASDGSTDRTVAIAHEFAHRGVRVLESCEWRGKASIVNEAIAASTGDVLCLCDANVLFEPDALTRLVARLDDPLIGAASGDVRLDSQVSNFGAGESLYYRLERSLQRAESRVGSLMGVDGGMYVLRRELYQPLTADTVLDDFVTSMNIVRQGRRIVYEPLAVASENGTPLSIQEFRRRMRVAAGAAQALKRGNCPSWKQPIELWQFLSHKLLRWLGAVWLVLLLVSGATLASTHWVYLAVLGAQAVFYGCALTALASVAFRRTRLGGIPFYFSMSHLAMFLGMIRGLFNLQPAVWDPAVRTPMTTSVT